MKKFSALLLMLLIFSGALIAQQKVVIRINNPSPEMVKYFAGNNYDITAFTPGKNIDLFITEQEHDRLVAEGYDIEIVQTAAEMRANLQGTDDIPGYRTYDEALAELQQMVNDHPDICQLFDLGDSRGKHYYNAGNNNYIQYQHDIWGLKVSSNVQMDEDKPGIYYMGAHHAREPISTEVVFYILNHVLDNYGTDPEITASVNNKELWFIPIVNPDGHKIVLDQVDMSWRKNIRDNDNDGQITFSGGWDYPDGVDPNRNYGWHWGGEGASSNPSDQTYRGPSALSEPEVQAMRDLMEDRHFVAGLNYHSYSELVLWPFGYTSNAYGPDANALAALGTAMAQTIPKIGAGHYEPGPAWSLYPAAGNTDDYAYGQHGIFSILIELATQFIPPQNQVIQICQDNLESALILMNRVDASTLTGLVTNANTGEPVVAEVFVYDIDDTGLPREPYKSSEQFGRYFRMLPNDTYTVTFSSFGYISQTFNSVNINGQDQTILDVELVPGQIITVSGTVTDADTGEPIEGASIEVLGTPLDPVYTNDNGEYVIEEIFENTYSFSVWAENYAMVVQQVTVTPQSNIVDFELTESNAVSFNAGVFPPGWTFAGSSNWFIDNSTSWDGEYSARSGAISDNQTTQVLFTMEAASDGIISFYRKVSSEANYDYLKFYINNNIVGQWAGELDWAEVSFPVNAGVNTFKWVYEKDVYVSSGQDCAWIDYIIFPPSASVNANAGADGEICEGDNFQCEGSAAYYETLEWTTDGDGTFSDPAILNPVYTPGTNDIVSGEAGLTLTAIDGDGNQDADNLQLTINPMPETGTTISGLEEVCAGSPEVYSCIEIEHADSYEWEITPEAAGTIQSQTDNEITILWADNYFDLAYIKVRGTNDCGNGEYSEEFEVYVSDCTGIEDISSTGFSIYPNPADDLLFIHFGEVTQEEVNITVYNLTGEIMYDRQQLLPENHMIKIDLNHLSSGVYFVTASQGINMFTKKLIINKK
jgi:carboxypeptidase T